MAAEVAWATHCTPTWRASKGRPPERLVWTGPGGFPRALAFFHRPSGDRVLGQGEPHPVGPYSCGAGAPGFLPQVGECGSLCSLSLVFTELSGSESLDLGLFSVSLRQLCASQRQGSILRNALSGGSVGVQ